MPSNLKRCKWRNTSPVVMQSERQKASFQVKLFWASWTWAHSMSLMPACLVNKRLLLFFATYSTVPLIHTSSWGCWRSEAKQRWAREGSAGLNSREGGGRVPGVEVFSIRLACQRNMGRSRLATRVKKYFKTCWSTSGGQKSKGSIHQ